MRWVNVDARNLATCCMHHLWRQLINISKDCSSQTKEHELRAKGEGNERFGVSKWEKGMDLYNQIKSKTSKKLICLLQFLFFVISFGFIPFLFHLFSAFPSKPFARCCWEIYPVYYKASERCSDLTGNAGHSGSSDPGPYPGQGHCVTVLFFGKTYSACLHLGA